jgi:hypothetical protein
MHGSVVDSQLHLWALTHAFLRYYKMGNIGIIGYSGGHDYTSMRDYFEESCSFMQANNVEAVLLMGHWNTRGLGCPEDMNVPATYRQIVADIPACAAVESKLKYFEGHYHCNKVVEEDVGFMVRAAMLLLHTSLNA